LAHGRDRDKGPMSRHTSSTFRAPPPAPCLTGSRSTGVPSARCATAIPRSSSRFGGRSFTRWVITSGSATRGCANSVGESAGHIRKSAISSHGTASHRRVSAMRTTGSELSALRAGGDQELACGVTLSSEVGETAAGRKPRAIIQTASTISCTARGMNNKVCSVELVPMTAYIASRSAAT